MRIEEQPRVLTTPRTAVAAPLSLGLADCAVLALGAVLMAVSILWPIRRRRFTA